MSELGQRLVEFRTHQNMSQSALARALGSAQSTISQIEKGKSLPSADLLRKLITHYDLSSDWLLTGRGDPGYDEPEAPDISQGGSIALVRVAAQAGYAESKGGEDFISTLDRFKIPGIDNTEDLRIFEIEGDSMMPTFYPGDYVVCSRMSSPYRIDADTLGVVLSEDGVFIKRLKQFDGQHQRALILQSDNASYRPMMLDMDRVYEVWRVEQRLTSSFDYVLLLDHQRFSKLERELELLRHQFGQLRHEVGRNQNTPDEDDSPT